MCINTQLLLFLRDDYLDIENNVALATYKFNSRIQAGEVLLSKQFKVVGKERILFSADKKPALVLQYMPNAVGNKYRSKVQYLAKQEFAVKNIALFKEADEVAIHFDAVANMTENIKYQIIKKDASGKESVIHTVIPSPIENWEVLEIKVPFEPKASYSLVITNSEEVRIKRDLAFVIKDQDRYVVYPTLAKDLLHIDFLQSNDWARYAIVNMNGQVLTKNSLKEQYNNIDVAHLAPGNYIVTIELEDRSTKSISFSKQ